MNTQPSGARKLWSIVLKNWHKKPHLSLLGLVLSLCSALPANAMPILTGSLDSQAGAQNATLWTIGVHNSGADTALNARIDSLNLTQTSGPACSPAITTSLPSGLGNIAAGNSVQANITIDFTGCFDGDPSQSGWGAPGFVFITPPAYFDLAANFSSDAGLYTGSLFLSDVSRLTFPGQPPETTVPEPASLYLVGIGLTLLFRIAGAPRTNRRQQQIKN